MQRSRIGLNAGFLVAAFVTGLSGAPLLAQTASGAADQSRSLDVHAQRDGTFVVNAAGTPFDDLIRSIAAVAGLQLSTVGTLPRTPTTVVFAGDPANNILQTLLTSAGINYVLVGTHLHVGVFAARAGVQPQPAPAAAPVAPMPPPAAEKVASVADPDDVPQKPGKKDKPADTDNAKAEPTEWPSGIEPASPGAPANLPKTQEALFLEVNGSLPTILPKGVTPNIGPTPSPEQIEPVNPVKPGAPQGSATPGVPSAAGTPIPNAGAPAAPDPKMMVAPKTIQVPGPVIVEFKPNPPKF